MEPRPTFGRLENSEKTIAILRRYKWWLQTAKQDGGRISKRFLCSIWKKRNERPNVGVVSARRRNGAPSRKGCVVSGPLTKASNKLVPPVPPWNDSTTVRSPVVLPTRRKIRFEGDEASLYAPTLSAPGTLQTLRPAQSSAYAPNSVAF